MQNTSSTSLSNAYSPISEFISQVVELTFANLKVRYRGTIIGFLWVLIDPLTHYLVMAFVFHIIVKIEIPNYFLFLLGGLVPWSFFSKTLNMCVSKIVNEGSFIKSFQINPLVLIVSEVLDNTLNFALVFLILLVPTIYLQGNDWAGFMLLPFCILNLFIGGFAISWLLATLQVFYYDTRYVLSFFISILFFLTPIFYPERFVPQEFLFLIYLNPAYYIIDPFRAALYNFEFISFLKSITVSLAVNLSFLVLAKYYWSKKRNALYFRI